jgi:hypothetical protein
MDDKANTAVTIFPTVPPTHIAGSTIFLNNKIIAIRITPFTNTI